MKLITMLDALYDRLLHEYEGLHFSHVNMHIHCKEILLGIVNHDNANDAFARHRAYRGGFRDVDLPCAASWILWQNRSRYRKHQCQLCAHCHLLLWVANIVGDMTREKGGEESKALEMGRDGTRTADDGMLEQLLGLAKDGKEEKRKRTKTKKSKMLGFPGVIDGTQD